MEAMEYPINTKHETVLFTIMVIFIGISFLALIHKDAARGATESKFFEPDIYFANVLQVGGVGSDMYSAKAYFIGDGTAHQEGWPNYLSKDYAQVSFNSPFYIMYLYCKDGYKATVMSEGYFYGTSTNESFSAAEDKLGNSLGFGIRIEDVIKNTIALKCEKK